jgi:hypothetical protein
MDRHNISIYDSEKCRNILSQLPGIFAIRLHFGNGDNGAKDQLTEIHVLASTDRNPKQIARDIQSTLFAVYGVEIDHRIISIAQLPQNPFAAPQPVEAPVKPQSEPEAKAEASAETEETAETKETEETEETAETEAEIEPEIESEIEPLPEIKPEPQPVPEIPAKNEPDVNNAMYLINQLQNLAGNAAAEQNKDCSKETRLLFTGIDSSQYEAAAIDGATKWQQIIYVTLPHLRTMICILFIMNVGKIFAADFGLFYNVPMQNGALFSVTQVIDTYVYRSYMATGDPGLSSAAGLLQNALGFVCILTANSIVKKIDADSAMF